MNEFVQGPIGENVEHAISDLRNEEGHPAVGNVLRRTCEWAGEGVCKQVCQLRDIYEARGTDAEASDKVAEALAESACADINLLHAFNELGLEPANVLMVGVTANEVGFVDQLDDYDKLANNPYGWQELPGFNAFFSREDEVDGIGRRLADCADINFEFQDRDGQTVFGFEHGTRTNMFGSGEYAFEQDGKKMSFTEYTMRQAIEHYGADPGTMRISLAAAIKGENNEWHFDDIEKIEKLLPGWREDGFLQNISNPNWQLSDPLSPDDTWEADTKGMITRDIEEAMQALGIPAGNLDTSGALDPNESQGMHSSHKTSYLTDSSDTRDLYITYVKP